MLNKKNIIFVLFALLVIAGIIFLGHYQYQVRVLNTSAKADIKVRSIDTQIVSKCWKNTSKQNIDEQVYFLKKLNVNYIAIGTPYDRSDELAIWADSIHKAGLNVWFRSHWLAWEGDEGEQKKLTPTEYISKTKNFILSHQNIFKEGDAFTASVEAENVGVGESKPFNNWDEYRSFLKEEIELKNLFESLGHRDIHTNWLSMNGWVIENELNQEIVDQMGLITADHYVDQNMSIDSKSLAAKLGQDYDRFYAKWQVPILVGEWGYHIKYDISDTEQAQFVSDIYSMFYSKSYIYGINYWDHVGNSSKIIADKNGSDLTYRSAAEVIKNFYNQ